MTCRRTLAAVAVVASLGLTGCDALDAALGDTDGDGSAEPGGSGAASGPGEPEDWLHEICGDDAEIVEEEPYEDQFDDNARQLEYYTCTVPGADVGDAEVEEYEVEAIVYADDPEDDLVGEADSYKSGDGNELAWAYLELEETWAVVWLLPSFGKAQESVLEPLEERGFDVDAVDYGG